MSYPVAAAINIVVFIGIARIIEGFTGKHSGIVRGFLIGVGIMAISLSAAVLAFPLFGARLAAIMIGIGSAYNRNSDDICGDSRKMYANV